MDWRKKGKSQWSTQIKGRGVLVIFCRHRSDRYLPACSFQALHHSNKYNKYPFYLYMDIETNHTLFVVRCSRWQSICKRCVTIDRTTSSSRAIAHTALQILIAIEPLAVWMVPFYPNAMEVDVDVHTGTRHLVLTWNLNLKSALYWN